MNKVRCMECRKYFYEFQMLQRFVPPIQGLTLGELLNKALDGKSDLLGNFRGYVCRKCANKHDKS